MLNANKCYVGRARSWRAKGNDGRARPTRRQGKLLFRWWY